MTPQKRQRLMFAVLIVSVVFGLYMKPWERPRRNVAAPSVEGGATESEPASTSVSTAVSAIAFVDEWPARDPFTRADEYAVHHADVVEPVSIGEPTFSLQGIVTIDGQAACVIDGSTHMVGSHCSGWRLDRIGTDGIWVSQGGERRFVPLP